MRIVLGILAAIITAATISTAFAHEGYLVDCSKAPQSEWAKCIIDQNQDQASQ